MRYISLILIWHLGFLSCKTISPNLVEEPKNEEPSVVFAVIGDYGSGGQGEAPVADMVKSWNPQFILTLGDNNYGDLSLTGMKAFIGDYYQDFIYNPDAPESYQAHGLSAQEMQNRFFPAAGNHDMNKMGSRNAYLSYFTLPGNELYYDIRWNKDIHIFILDSGGHGESECCETEQGKWLRNGLRHSTANYKLVLFHHPPYAAISRKSYHKMRWPFEEWGASVVLNGHDHVYARIASKKSPSFFYLINGLGGARKYKCDPFQLPRSLFRVFCYDDNFGAIIGRQYNDELRLEFRSIDRSKPIDVVRLSKK